MHDGLSEAWRAAAVKAERAAAPIEHLLSRLAALRIRRRKEMEREFPTDSELEAFCIDCFPTVHARFTNGMDRIQKLDLLLREIDPETLSAALKLRDAE